MSNLPLSAERKNGEIVKFPIEGTKLRTDSIGIAMLKQMQEHYVGKPVTRELRKSLRQESWAWWQKLKSQGRLWRKDGSQVI